MPVWLIIILGLFVVGGLPELIKYIYTTATDKVYEIKLTKERNKKQAKVDIVRNNSNIVRSKERIYFGDGFFNIKGENFDYFLSEDGNAILGPYTKIISGFSGKNSLASVLIGDDVFYINNRGEKVLGPFKDYRSLDGWFKYPRYKDELFYVSYEPFEEGYASLFVSRKSTLFDYMARVVVNKDGDIIHVSKKDEYIASFSEGLLAIKENNSVFFIDEKGNKKLGPYEYDSWWTAHTRFCEGLAVVKIDGKNWYIDKDGKKQLGPYDRAYSFTNEGFAYVKLTNDEGVACIDRQGNYIWGPSKDYNFMKYCPSEGCVLLESRQGSSYSLIDVFNNKVLGTFRDCTWVKNNHAIGYDSEGWYIICKDGTKKDIEELGFIINSWRVAQCSSNGWFSVYLKNDSSNMYYSINGNGELLKMSDSIVEKLLNAEVPKSTLKNIEGPVHHHGDYNPFIEAYLKVFPNEEQDARAKECAAKNRAALMEASKPKPQENKTTTVVVSRPEPKSNFNGKEDGYNVIGVQFDNYRRGCYYYYGDNKTYNINDRVLVPTGNNGNQEATVVFRKIYTQKSDIPYSGNLKWVIRKINDNGSKTKIHSNYDEIDYGCDDMYDVLYDEDTYVPDYDEDNNYFDDDPWWDTTKMSNPDDTDLK